MAILQVPITKGKGTVEIDTDKDIPDAVYAEALLQGLKVLLNRGMSKITKAELGDDKTVQVEAMIQAQKNVENLKAGKIKFSGKSAAKASGAVMTEARRIAKNLVKDEMKRHDIKVSHVAASEITKAANELLAQDPSIIETAKANLEARAAVPVKIDVTKIPISDKLVAKAEKEKAVKATQLSAKQAGMTQKAKPGTVKPAAAG